MKCPPMDWQDLWAIGLPADASISCDGQSVAVTPQPPRLVGNLLRAATASPPPPPEGDRMAYLRHVRDLLIGCTDWTQAADSPLTEEQRSAWATYRQALRDLPASYAGDGQIPWPVTPDQ
jgi:hypothetical protein